jgi:hypothetical protein
MLLRSQRGIVTKVAVVSALRINIPGTEPMVKLILAPGPEQARCLGSPYSVPVQKRVYSDLELAALLQHANHYPALVGEFFSMCEYAFQPFKNTNHGTSSAGFTQLYLPVSITSVVTAVAMRPCLAHNVE